MPKPAVSVLAGDERVILRQAGQQIVVPIDQVPDLIAHLVQAAIGATRARLESPMLLEPSPPFPTTGTGPGT